jgi:hypothetical protein
LEEELFKNENSKTASKTSNGNIGNTGNGDLELPQHDPSGFELLIKWLYQGKLTDVRDIPGAEQKYAYAVKCHSLYLLCERFGMESLKNIAIDQYRRGLHLSGLVPDAQEIRDIYHASLLGSPWRKLMAEIAARQIMAPDATQDVEMYRECMNEDPGFAVELVKAIKRGVGGVLLRDPTEEGRDCEYHDHEHEAGASCRSKGKGSGKQGEYSFSILSLVVVHISVFTSPDKW